MRTTHGQRNASNDTNVLWKWIIGIGLVLCVFFVSRFFTGENIEKSGNFLTVTPNKGSSVYIKNTESKKELIKTAEKLYTTDYSVFVATGSANIAGEKISIDIDKATEVKYTGSGEDDQWITLLSGHWWVESKGNTTIKMKNITASLASGDIVVIDQTTQVYSKIYAIHGNIFIKSGDKTYTLPVGKWIMIVQSDIIDPEKTLESLSEDIGNNLDQMGIFIAHNGADILNKSLNSVNTNSWESFSGSMILSGSTMIEGNGWKYIELTSPTDGATLPTATVIVSGKILSNDVKKIIINDREALISPVEETFIIKDFLLPSASSDLVIKAYDAGGNRLGSPIAISVNTKAKTTGNDKLIPTNFWLWDKNYRIISPTENPYRTNKTNITVSWVVPAGTVSYITVNGYKLQKYTPKSATWYYYANITYGTMKEGFNLYEIKFFWESGDLLSSQVFTIIKEWGLVSGESR